MSDHEAVPVEDLDIAAISRHLELATYDTYYIKTYIALLQVRLEATKERQQSLTNELGRRALASEHAVAEVVDLEEAVPLWMGKQGLWVNEQRAQNANRKAWAQYGDNVRIVRILDNDDLDIHGNQLPLVSRFLTPLVRERRERLMSLLINTRGRKLKPNEIQEMMDLNMDYQIVNFLKPVSAYYVDAEGQPIIIIERLNKTNARYYLAEDVVIIDCRSIEIQRLREFVLNNEALGEEVRRKLRALSKEERAKLIENVIFKGDESPSSNRLAWLNSIIGNPALINRM